MKKKYSLLIITIAIFFVVSSCSNDEDINTGNSIFDTEIPKGNAFDLWLINNYVYPYNIKVKYRLDDTETDVKYDLVPAEYDRSVALMKIVKHVWLEAYDEVWGIDCTRTYVPKLIQLIGNVAYTESGMILGTAEGGMKVTLFRVNAINPLSINVKELNDFYFKTMHHEFVHILNQTKAYDPAFERITESDYVGTNWYQVSTFEAWEKGFVSPYAMDRATEDFAEVMSIFVTTAPISWEAMMLQAGNKGRSLIQKKFDTVYNYMKNSWKVDLYKLRDVVQRRQMEISKLDLSTIK